MERMRNVALTTGFIAAVLALPATAMLQDQSASTDEIQKLREELARTNANMQAMRSELNELRAASNEEWITEQRAQEVRAIVADILADADTRASLSQDGMTAGWLDHFFMSSPDGRFKLQLEGQMQLRHVFNRHDAADRWINGFENARTRLAFRGHVFNRDLTYMVRGAFDRSGGQGGGDFRLEDAWVRFELNNDFSFRIGQFKTPFNREELVSSAYQLAVERSLLNESINLGRTQGIEFAFAGESLRWVGVFGDGGTDNLGGFNVVEPGGDPQNSSALTADVDYAATTRLEYKLAGTWGQFEDFTSPPDEPFGMLLGGAVHVQKSEHGAATFARQEDHWYAVTADLSIEGGGWNAFVSGTYHWVDTPGFDLDVYGIVGQVGHYITPSVEVFGRYEWGRFDVTLDTTQFTNLGVATIGMNYYFDTRNRHAAKLTIDFGYNTNEIDAAWDSDLAGWRTDGPSGDPQMVLRTQFQLLF